MARVFDAALSPGEPDQRAGLNDDDDAGYRVAEVKLTALIHYGRGQGRVIAQGWSKHENAALPRSPSIVVSSIRSSNFVVVHCVDIYRGRRGDAKVVPTALWRPPPRRSGIKSVGAAVLEFGDRHHDALADRHERPREIGRSPMATSNSDGISKGLQGRFDGLSRALRSPGRCSRMRGTSTRCNGTVLRRCRRAQASPTSAPV